MYLRLISVFSLALFMISCSEGTRQNRGPIVLGDSSTIVTETDSKYLRDFVDDIKVRAKEQDTTEVAQPETQPETFQRPDETNLPVTTEPQKPEVQEGKGLNIPFKEVTVYIPNIETKTYREQNLQLATGASYLLTEGELNGNKIHLNGNTSITKVSQRYITAVEAKNELGSLIIDGLSNTTDWQTIRGKNNIYLISGLEPNKLDYKRATPAQIKNAVSKAAKNKRMSKKNIQKWENSVRNVRSVDQKPFNIILRSVMWKIEGKDATGKPFQKQVRIDLP